MPLCEEINTSNNFKTKAVVAVLLILSMMSCIFAADDGVDDNETLRNTLKLINEGNYVGARDELLQYVSEHDDARVTFLLGRVSEKLNQLDKAYDWYKKALQLSLDMPEKTSTEDLEKYKKSFARIFRFMEYKKKICRKIIEQREEYLKDGKTECAQVLDDVLLKMQPDAVTTSSSEDKASAPETLDAGAFSVLNFEWGPVLASVNELFELTRMGDDHEYRLKEGLIGSLITGQPLRKNYTLSVTVSGLAGAGVCTGDLKKGKVYDIDLDFTRPDYDVVEFSYSKSGYNVFLNGRLLGRASGGIFGDDNIPGDDERLHCYITPAPEGRLVIKKVKLKKK